MEITEILIIVASETQKELFIQYLGNGYYFGVSITYVVQTSPNGLAEAFIIGEEFIGDDDVTLILGDNVLLGDVKIDTQPNNIFTYKVKNPSAYGVAVVKDSELIDIVEKPTTFISDDAVIGLYVFTNLAVKLAKQVKPSPRGELEIVDLIKLMNYEEGVSVLPFTGIWFDCGSHDDLLECAEFVRALDKRTNSDILLKRTYE